MSNPEVHLLTGVPGDMIYSQIACGNGRGQAAAWDAKLVTCPLCLRHAGHLPIGKAHQPEAHLQELVRRLALEHGWRYYHTFDSRKSPPGFPDCVLLKGPTCLIAELKSAAGKLTPEQHDWLEAWQQVQAVQVHVWRPGDVPTIHKLLRQG
jgi:hypothetical protein